MLGRVSIQHFSEMLAGRWGALHLSASSKKALKATLTEVW